MARLAAVLFASDPGPPPAFAAEEVEEVFVNMSER